MEDSDIAEFNIAEDIHLFGVFDGHGGFEVARFVERHFKRELLNDDKFKSSDYKGALENAFLKMDELILSEEGKKEI